MLEKAKNRAFEFIWSGAFSVFIMTLILLNVLAIVLESVEELAARYESLFAGFELFSVVVFTIEYLIRLWVCTADSRYRGPISGRLRFALTPLALVDLLAILPFYLPMILPLDLRFIRVVRLIRIFRVFKLGRYSKSLQTLGRVLVNKRGELSIAVFVVSILLIIASSLMYFFENEAQPEAFSNIPMSMWWGVSTLTTVGYGDVYPITAGGKIFGAIIAILGIGMFALPAGILGSGFIEEMQRRPVEVKVCPHCGKKLGS